MFFFFVILDNEDVQEETVVTEIAEGESSLSVPSIGSNNEFRKTIVDTIFERISSTVQPTPYKVTFLIIHT